MTWTELDPVRARAVEKELQREVAPGHPLHGKQVEAVAVSDEHEDDVLFRLNDGTFAFVHLTWQVESTPTWPFCRLYATFAEAADAFQS